MISSKYIGKNSTQSIWIFISILCFGALGIISTDSTTIISFYSITALLISFVIYNESIILSHGSMTIRMLILGPMLQFAYIALFFLFGGSTQIFGNYYNIDVGEFPFRVIFSLLVLPVSFLVGSYLFGKTFMQSRKLDYKIIKDMKYDRFFEGLLIIAACNLMFYRIGLMRLPILSTGLSFLYLTLQLGAFLIGFFSREYKLARNVFFIVYIISSIISFSEGSRSTIFIPAAFFFFGYIQKVSFKKRLILLAISTFVFPILLTISGGMEEVRSTVRSDQEHFDIGSNINEMSKNISNILSINNVSSNIWKGMARLIDWSNLAVASMTPAQIPYRGFSDFAEEIESRLQFSFMNPYASEDVATRDFGLGAANIYGFGITRGGTVPFPIFADTWSRGGIVYTFSIGILLCLIFGYIEKNITIMFSGNRYLALFFVTLISSVAFVISSVYGVIYTIRLLFLSSIVWFLLLKLYANIYNIFYPARSRWFLK